MSTSISIQNIRLSAFKIPFWWSKIIRFEFWPAWFLYLPVIIYTLWLAAKVRSLTFFTSANPLMLFGGLIGESKTDILKAIPHSYLPKSVYCKLGSTIDDLQTLLDRNSLSFPLVIKPDMGERGNGVEVIETIVQLKSSLANQAQDFILQEFIAYPIELGILYYRFPDGSKSGITSITSKQFLTVKGNGQNTLNELLLQSERAQLRLNYLQHKFQHQLNEVLPIGERILLEPIGNHCRGTLFIDENKYITPQLVSVFDSISAQINGFYIGRFDLKVSSIQDLMQGNNIQIMELNGVTSEPAHIYDPNTSLIEAYKALFNHWQLVYQISMQNRQRGFPFATLKEVLKHLQNHYSQKR